MSLRAAALRHWDVFKAALELDKAQAATRRQHAETQFLPAALEVMETPPSPMARALLLALCVLVGIALLWSILGKVDLVAVAPGKIIPEARVKVIQWGGAGIGSEAMTGVVRAIHVREGQRVRAGQLLVELDPTITGADEAQATRGLLAAQAEVARGSAVSGYLRSGRLDYAAPDGTAADVAATQRDLLGSIVAEYEARRASLTQQRAERQADAAAAREELAMLQESLPLLEKQVAARLELAEKGYGSKLLLWQQQEQLVERRGNIGVQRANLARAQAAIAGLDQQLAQLRQELSRSALTEQTQAQDEASLRAQEITKAAQRRRLTRIIAPVDGVVSQLALHTIGGVVQAAQPLMTIVPARSPLIVEAQASNRDVGFLRTGQPVAVKLEAYPFTDHGLIDGRLVEISADSVARDPAGAGEGATRPDGAAGAAAGGLVYTVRVKLDPASVNAFAEGICVRRAEQLAARGESLKDCQSTVVTVGMAAQAEIRTGQRRIINYLLSPLAKTASEAARER